MFKTYLSGHLQAVVVNGVKSTKCYLLKYGVPQGSVLGPVLFIIYTQPLVNVISQFNLHLNFYADDSQIYDSDTAYNVDHLMEKFGKCLLKVKSWMNQNRQMLNEEKADLTALKILKLST